MGYDVHITRGTDWIGSTGHEITPEEWLALVAADPELRLAGYNGKYFTLWSGTSKPDEPWFDWRGGNVYTKNPDAPIIAKAIALASKLGARVVGDDGERYLPDGQIELDGEIQSGPGMDWRKYGLASDR